MRSILSCALFAFSVGCEGKALDLGGVPMDGSRPDSTLAAWPVTDQRNPRSLRSEGPHLYWIADRAAGSAILRCEKHDCANTLAPVVEVGTDLTGIEIRGDVLYAVSSTSIRSCRTSACSGLQTILSDTEVSAAAFDDANVYWSNRRKLAIFSCSVDGCGQARVVEGSVRTDAIELAVSDTALYWIQGDDVYPHHPGSVRQVPKDGSGGWTVVAGLQNQAASLTVRDEFVYWVTSFSVGAVMRCPLAGCSSGPATLADKQNFPHFVEPAGDMIFWMNGATWQEDERPVDIVGCRLGVCGRTYEMLDRGLGGSSGTRTMTFPSRELVADDDAIYWIGDVDAKPLSDGGVAVVASIRRTERRNVR